MGLMNKHVTNGSKWTEAEIEQVRALRNDGAMVREIAEAVGRSSKSVAYIIDREGIPKGVAASSIKRDSTGFPLPRRYTADEIAWAMENRNTSRDAKAIMALVEAGVA
jgi:hypothetical protein